MPDTIPSLDELISLAVTLEAEGKDTDGVYQQMMDIFPDADFDEIEAKLAQARFNRSLFATKL